MSTSKRAWLLASVIVAVAALVDGSLRLPGSSVTGPAGVLVIAIGLMPAAFLLAGIVDRRRMVGALHIGAGVLLGIAGFVLASQDGFQRLKLALIDWRLLVTSGPSLTPVGLMTVGLALVLTGTGLLLLQRRLAVLSALVVGLTSGFFTGSLTLVPYLRFRHFGLNVVDMQAVVAAIVMALAALLLVIAALSRYPVRWVPLVSERPGNAPGDDGSTLPDEVAASHPRRHWVKAAAWAAVGAVAVAAIGVGAWLTLAPRFVLAEVFPDHNLALCVARATGVSGPSAKVSQLALTQVSALPCSDYRTKAALRQLNGAQNNPSGRAFSTGSVSPEPAPEERIRSLQGLDRLTNLASLGVRSNDISDLTPLASLDKLADVMLADNEVTDLTPLAGLPVLSGLDLSANTISDLTPLARVRPLRSLHLANNKISDLSPLAGLPVLSTLDAGENHISDLTPLASLHKLGQITLTHNRVSDLTPLAGLPALSDLGLSDNMITDLTPLAGVHTLRFLGLNKNQVSDLAPLAGLTGLSKLDAAENQIADVTPLAHLPELRRLTLPGNRIVNAAPLRALPALAMLNISQNRVADARTFTGFVTLEELWVGGNPLTDVTPLAALPALTGVDFEGTMSSSLVGLDLLRAHNVYVGGFA